MSFAQSVQKINGGKFVVILNGKPKRGIHIGVSTRGLNKDTKKPEAYAKEYYMLDCKKQTFNCNTYSTHFKDWPKKYKKGDKIIIWMSDTSLYFMHNENRLGKIDCPRFKHE